MKITQLIGLGAIAALTACAQPAPPPAIQGEVIMNKYGEPTGCVDGYYIPGAPYQEQCFPPPEDCDPQLTATAAIDDCLPWDDPNRGDRPGNNGRTPTGQTNLTTGP